MLARTTEAHWRAIVTVDKRCEGCTVLRCVRSANGSAWRGTRSIHFHLQLMPTIPVCGVKRDPRNLLACKHE